MTKPQTDVISIARITWFRQMFPLKANNEDGETFHHFVFTKIHTLSLKNIRIRVRGRI